MIEFLKRGLLTTVQDIGRYGYQRMGINVAGAMDELALALANILVGNAPETEALEATVLGPTLKFHQANIFAISGADFGARLNGQPIELNRAYLAQAGSILELPVAKTGARAYIAFSGGLAADCLMESKSTYMKGVIGGIHGRAALDGDMLAFCAPRCSLPNLPYRFLGEDYGIHYCAHPVIRVLLGPQDDYFSAEGIETFLSSEYTVSKENDRMGYRLTGPAIEAAEGCDGNIISDGISFGAIQVPTDQPIIMMADHQTTGGYAKIAHVIAVDLPLVAQLKTGDTMRFRAVGVEEAQDLYLQRYQMLCETARHLNEDKISRKTENQVRINGQSFHVLVAELK